MRAIGLYPSAYSKGIIPASGMIFPVAPGTLSVTTSSNYATHDYVSRGTVNRFVGEAPRRISWDSVLPRIAGLVPSAIPGSFRPPDEIRSIIHQALDQGALPTLRLMDVKNGEAFNLYVPQTVKIDSFSSTDRGGQPNLVYYAISVTEVNVANIKKHYLSPPTRVGATYSWNVATDETIIGAADQTPPPSDPTPEPPPPADTEPDYTTPTGANALKLTRDAQIERKRNENVSVALKRVYKRDFPNRWLNVILRYNCIDNGGYVLKDCANALKGRKPKRNPVKFVIIPAIVFGPAGPFGVWSG